MSTNLHQLRHLNENYQAIKGTRVRKFVCPITLGDDPNAELCDGHILNEAIRKASRATIIQRKDVDNYFGTTIEPDVVQWLNIPELTPKELFSKSSNLQITIPNGEKSKLFFTSRRSVGDRFPQIDLFNPDGTVVAKPFVKTDNPALREFKDAEVEGKITLNNGAFLGSLIKSAYLTCFRLFGYEWVFSAGGDKVRRALATFYNAKAGRGQAHNYFLDFEGAVSVELTKIFQDKDTLQGGCLFLHFVRGTSKEILFALSCLFRINERTITVTLPSFLTTGFDLGAYSYYQSFLKDHSMPHNVYPALLENGIIRMDPRPLRIHHVK